MQLPELITFRQDLEFNSHLNTTAWESEEECHLYMLRA